MTREGHAFFCPCRSRLAGEKLESSTGHQAHRVIVGDFRRQAGAYKNCVKIRAKKRATEVAQNALRAHVTRKNLWFFTLIRVFPDKKTKPYKKQHHEADSQHPGENHIIEKHDRPPALALLRWG
ncbi:hypothetical protein HU732_16435 [Pseudomonas proteolytica]|nr:hypothetical protein [Pseudomonas proteolytica]